MYRVAVMGDRDSIYGYAAIGLDIHPVTDLTRAGAAASRAGGGRLRGDLRDGGPVAEHIKEEMAFYRDRKLPAILPIPGASGNTGLGMAQVKKYVEQAVGSDILSLNS